MVSRASRGATRFLGVDVVMSERAEDEQESPRRADAPRSPLQPQQAKSNPAAEVIARIEPVVPAVNAERLERDRATLLRLQLAGFEGTEWEELQGHLWLYAFKTFPAKILSGEIFKLLRESSLPASRDYNPPPGPAITRQEAEDLTIDLIGSSLRPFRQRLMAGAWDPYRDNVASLDTYWFGWCLLQFPKPWRKWLRQRRNLLRELSGPLLVDISDRRQAHLTGPEAEIVLRLDIQRGLERLSEVQRAVMITHATGLTGKETAAALGISEKSAEYQLQTARRRLKSFRESDIDIA